MNLAALKRHRQFICEEIRTREDDLEFLRAEKRVVDEIMDLKERPDDCAPRIIGMPGIAPTSKVSSW